MIEDSTQKYKKSQPRVQALANAENRKKSCCLGEFYVVFNFSYKNRLENQDLETEDCSGGLIPGWEQL